MKKILLPVLMLLFATGCNAQRSSITDNNDTTRVAESKPGVSWKVNRRYDDKGNLIGYDSTAVWSYQGGQQGREVAVDSVMMAFREQFDKGFPSFFRERFGAQMWQDSLFYRDFITPDYFMQRWEHDYFDIGGMMQQMDSLRNSFLQQNYPGLMVPGRINTL